jgi:ring-1,2-phenylacetyl-CoA epoxidase subunit PaaD
MVTKDKIWELLEQVFDPEVPVLNIVDLGIVRTVELNDNSCKVTITPTYSGCPAMKTIEEEIQKLLQENDIEVEIESTLSPAWTTDWISENGKNKLREYGIAPPENEVDKSVLFAEQTIVPCPLCRSKNTKMVSLFGSTACKAHYQCNDCLEPFDYFKCLK